MRKKNRKRLSGLIIGMMFAASGMAMAAGIGNGSGFGWKAGSDDESGKKYAGAGIGTENMAGWRGRADSRNKKIPFVTLHPSAADGQEDEESSTEALLSELETEALEAAEALHPENETEAAEALRPENETELAEALSPEQETEPADAWISENEAEMAEALLSEIESEGLMQTDDAAAPDPSAAADSEDEVPSDPSVGTDSEDAGLPDPSAGTDGGEEASVGADMDDAGASADDSYDIETAEAIRFVTGQDAPGYQDYQERRQEDIASTSGVYMASDEDDEGEVVLYQGTNEDSQGADVTGLDGGTAAGGITDDGTGSEISGGEINDGGTTGGGISGGEINDGGITGGELTGDGTTGAETTGAETTGAETTDSGTTAGGIIGTITGNDEPAGESEAAESGQSSQLDPIFSEPAGQLYRSNTDGYVNLRSDPNTGAMIIGQIQPRDICMQMDEEVSGNWIHILYLDGEDRQNVLTGWSSGEYLDETSIWELTGRRSPESENDQENTAGTPAISSDAIMDSGSVNIGDLPEGIDTTQASADSAEGNGTDEIWLPAYKLLVQAWQIFNGVGDPSV